jgi:hypothetical protein
MRCQFCKSEFVSKYTMQNHQKRAKYCLFIQKKASKQDIKDELKQCKHCDKKFACNVFTRHDKICRKKQVNTISILNNTIQTLKDQLSESHTEVLSLKDQLSIYKKLSESSSAIVAEIAKQPHIQNTHNIQNNKWGHVTPFNLLHDEKEQEKLKGLFEEHYGEGHFYEGQRGIARFAHQHILKDPEGNTKYRCTDSRNNFKYKNSSGDICKDYKAVKLAQLLGNSVRPITKSMLADLSDGMDSTELMDVIKNYQEINGMENDNGKFRSELRTLTSD